MSHRTVLRIGQAAASTLLLGQLLSGCAYGELRQVLRAEVASEADCPELQVTKVPAYAEGYQDNQFYVKGCGIDRVYTCNDEGGLVKFGSADCKYANAGATQPAAGAPPAAAPMMDDMGDEGGLDSEPGAEDPDSAEPADEVSGNG